MIVWWLYVNDICFALFCFISYRYESVVWFVGIFLFFWILEIKKKHENPGIENVGLLIDIGGRAIPEDHNARPTRIFFLLLVEREENFQHSVTLCEQ